MLQIEPLRIDVFKMAKVGGNHFERVGPNRHSVECGGIDLADEARSRTQRIGSESKALPSQPQGSIVRRANVVA